MAVGDSAQAAGGPEIEEIGDFKFMSRFLTDVPAKDLKSVADEMKKQIGSGVVTVASAAAVDSATVVVGVTTDLTNRFDAVEFARVGAEVLGGTGGGGRPDRAQAGGPNKDAAEDALAAIKRALAEKAKGV